MVILAAANALPVVLLLLAGWRYREEAISGASGRRRTVLVPAFIACATNHAVLVGFLIHGRLIQSGSVVSADLDRLYPVAPMLGAGLMGAVLGLFGRGASRWLVVAAGLLVALLWYLAVMAASL